MDTQWQNVLHRRSFIGQSHEIQDTVRLVSPINRFAIFHGQSIHERRRPRKSEPTTLRTKLLIAATVILVFAAALAGYLIGSAGSKRRVAEPPDPIVELKGSPSKLRIFKKAAICTDSPRCSEIGRSMLSQNGSAIDAAIAAMFCNGMMNMQSMGIGGGFYMVVYIKDEGKAYVVNARETAPAKASVNMFEGNFDKASKGPLASGVPGEVRGYWDAHQRWGKLPWATLIEPTIKLCVNGYNISKALYDGVTTASWIKNDPHLRRQYYDSSKDKFHRIGTLVKPSAELCRTLSTIAEKGADEFYTGALAQDLADDLAEAKSIITAEDLRNYRVRIEDPLTVPMSNGDTIVTPGPPSGGIILVNILNILQGYNFGPQDIKTPDKKILTYHRIIEAFKYAFGSRTKMGDTAFMNLTEIINQLTNPHYGDQIRLRINDSSTSNDTSVYGAQEYNPGDSGTAHLSVIAENGDAVSVTSSVNFYFGAGYTLKRTGILMNNVMDDFSSPGITNFFGLKPSPSNFIAPGKRPVSSMTPTIILDDLGNAKMVLGGSGGTRIITAVALVAMRKLWFDQSIKQAVDEPRIHNQVFPMDTLYEYGVIENVIEGLRAKGHGLKRYRERGSIVCALYRNATGIYANADHRKGGDVSGVN